MGWSEISNFIQKIIIMTGIMFDWQLKYVNTVLFMYIYNYLHSIYTTKL